MVAPSVPAQDPPPEPRYFLIKLDLSQFNFANKDVRFNKVALPPEWLYVFFEYMDNKNAPVNPKGNPPPWLIKLPGAKKPSLYLRKHKWGTEAVITPIEKSKAIQFELAENKTPLEQYEAKKKKAGRNQTELRRLARWL